MCRATARYVAPVPHRSLRDRLVFYTSTMYCLLAIFVLLATATASAGEAFTTSSTPTTTTSTPPPTSTIPPGYIYYVATGRYYKFHHDNWVTWHVANTTCTSEGAHLIVLNNAEEADIIARIVLGAGCYGTWTGLHDNRPGGVMEWRTVHGEPLSYVYNVWGDGEPEDKPQYTCARFSPENKRLHDMPCDWTYYFTCEISQ